MGYKLKLTQVAFILESFYGGASIRRVTCQFRIFYGLPISPATVLRYVVRHSKLCYDAAFYFLTNGAIMLPHFKKKKYEFKLYLGDVWEIDETYLSVKGKRLPLILVRDLKTGFIIVGKLTESVTAKAIKEVLIMARALAFKSPKELRCDGLQSYARPVRIVFKGKTKLSVHKREGEMGRNEAIEGTIRALKDRLKRMLGLHSFKVSPIIVEGTILDFNFVRKSEALGSKTPAEVALKRKTIINQDEGWLFLLRLAKIYERIQCCKNCKKQRRNYLESDEHQTSLDSFID